MSGPFCRCGHTRALHIIGDPVEIGCLVKDCGCEDYSPPPAQTLLEQLEGQRKLAAERLRRIEKLEATRRPGDPSSEQLSQRLAAALERCAYEGHRADELHRTLNEIVTGLRHGSERPGADVLEEAEEALAIDKRRPALSVTCKSCGAEHGLHEWAALKFAGLQELADLPAEPLELRNCGCGSTLALPLRRLPLTR